MNSSNAKTGTTWPAATVALRPVLQILLVVEVLFAASLVASWASEGDRDAGLAAIIDGGAVLPTILVWILARRGRLIPAAMALAIAIILVGLPLAAIPPATPALAVLPLLGVSVALQYLDGPRLHRIAILAFLATIVTASIVELVPLGGPQPGWYYPFMRVASFGALVGLTLVLLVQFGRRLRDSLAEAEATSAALRTSEERVRTSLDTMLDPFIIASAVRDDDARIVDFRLEYVNEAWVRMTHAAREAQIGHTMGGTHAGLQGHLVAQFATVVETGAPLILDGLDVGAVMSLPGRIILDLRAVRLGDGIAASWRDVTAFIEAEQAVRASEERFRRITDTITDYVYTVRVEGGRAVGTDHGPGCVAVTGYGPEDFAEDPDLWLSMVVAEDRELVLDQAARVLARASVPDVEHRIIRKDGTERWVRSSIVPQCDPEGRLAGYDGIIQDVTERHALQDQLRQAQKMEAVGQLAGGIAHDFNNLLTAIRGYGELARRSLGPDDDVAADVEQVLIATDRAAELTRQLLAFSRRQVLQPEVLDPSAAVERLAPMLTRLLGEHIDLATRLSRGDGRVRVDPGQLEQVIVNLAVNARDAMPDGGSLTIETAEVWIDSAYTARHPEGVPGAYVLLQVSDTGIGMDEDTRAHVFEPFFTTKGLGRGTGMGLATVFGIVKQSGGLIDLYSEPGRGTTFRIYFPRVDAAAPEVIAPSAPVPGGSETILLAEDDGAVRGFARRVLDGRGYVTIEASTGEAALDAAERHAGGIDLLLTDVVMPGMNGRALAERLRGIRPGLRVLYVSGFADGHLQRSDLAPEDASFLPKPFDAETLARAVRRAIDGRPVGGFN